MKSTEKRRSDGMMPDSTRVMFNPPIRKKLYEPFRVKSDTRENRFVVDWAIEDGSLTPKKPAEEKSGGYFNTDW
jgi:hypothetical protein